MQANRYTLTLAGILLGFVDLWFALSVGVRFDINGRDASLWVLFYLALSFAGLGYLLGYLLELRRGERIAAERARQREQELVDARERLAHNEKLASLGQLAGAIAHEMRNPLAIIRSTVQNLEEDLPGDAAEARRDCSFVLEEIDRLSRVTGSLLDFTRPLQVVRESLRAGQLFERVEQLSRRMLEPRGVEIEVRDAEGGLELQADCDLLCQALLGLLDNAAQVTSPGDTVVLEAVARDSEVELWVEDRGPGVAEELRSKIFEPFFTTRGTGTGLGLPVARQIAEAHGGRLEFATAETGGARFALVLPRADLAEAA